MTKSELFIWIQNQLNSDPDFARTFRDPTASEDEELLVETIDGNTFAISITEVSG